MARKTINTVVNKEDITNNKSDDNNSELIQNIRPSFLADYIGQTKIKERIKTSIESARLRCTSMDHCLFYGPPGLGKTTLAMLIANEMQSKCITMSGPTIEKSGDLVRVLSTLQEGDILFIDEIHRLPTHIEEVLYSAMEDFKVDITIGSTNTPQGKTITIPLPNFTLIGATTKAGLISAPLRDRFGMKIRLEYYTDDELSQIVKRTSSMYSIELNDENALIIANASRGTPRIANSNVARVRDEIIVSGGAISSAIIKKALNNNGVYKDGLTDQDLKYLELLNKRNGNPIGLSTIASYLGEDELTIEDVIEPYLLRKGFIVKTGRGRIISESENNDKT